MSANERHEWEFDVPSSELAEKCEAKVTHHKERVKFYDGQHKELREKYIESVRTAAQNATEKEAQDAEHWAVALSALDEGDFETVHNRSAKFAYAGSSTVPAPRRREIMGDPEIYEELQKALSKLNEHRTNVETYTRWRDLLKRDPDGHTREVTFNDASFFGL